MVRKAKTVVPSAAAQGKNGHSLISDEKFRQLYGLALRCRLLTQRANGRAAEFAGREAALAGVAADLREGDALLADQVFEGLRGDLSATLRSPGAMTGADLLIDALGSAAADRMRKSGRVTVILFPEDGAESILSEARALAAAARLPVLFVAEAAGPAARSRRVHGNGASGEGEMTTIPVDMHDVIAMYRVAHESIARARGGSGPTRIVCVRPPAMSGRGEDWRNGDATDRLEHWLSARGLPAQQWRREIAAQMGIAI